MSRTRIKFCGIVDARDARDAAALGADMIGFVFYPRSPRVVDLAHAAGLRRALPSYVAAIGLFVDAPPDEVRRIAGAKLTVVPILRAGLGMLPGVLALLPTARISVVGLQRDEQSLQPVPYFERLTGRLTERDALILDPMLATGGTLIASIDMLKRAGARRIKGVFLVAAPEGLRALEAAHPDVEVYTAAIDERLDDNGYILPGLGDAGDRIFGTRIA